ncbi:MAG: nickel-dependent lactate racemase family protein [Terriglobia bacterium]
MKIPFSYSDVAPVEVAEANLLAILEPRSLEPSKPVEQLVEDALDHPIGSPAIEELVSPAARVLILVDDITRQTPAWAILPAVLRRLSQRGCPAGNVKILIAAGTHALMSPAEVEKKLGAKIPHQHEVVIHHWQKDENLKRIGVTADGTPVRVNRLLGESDVVIGVGQIVPHRVMGYTGGASIVQPGVSGREVTGYTHWMSALYAGREILGIAENPVRQEVESIARLAGLRFIVNVVMDARHRVIQGVAGDIVAAHRKGTDYSRTIYGMPQAALADIVMTESYPADYDLWQAAKGIYSAELAVREGGVVIIVTPCPHGVSTEHPEVERLGYHGFAKVKSMVEKKQITDLVAAAHLVHVGRVVRDRARGIMVSPGIDPITQAHLGFESASTPQRALEMAYKITGPQARVVVLRHGGDVLPVVIGEV